MRLARLVAIALAFILLAELAAQFVRYLSYVRLLYPLRYGLDFGEGIVLQQTMLIPGGPVYGDIAKGPFFTFTYPPVFHVLTWLIRPAIGDLLTTGRLVSVAAALLTALTLGVLAYRAGKGLAPGRVALPAAVCAALLVFTYQPVVQWSVCMRVDMLAVALAYGGVLLGVLSLHRPRLMAGSAAMFVLAVFTKQTQMVPALATFAVLLVARPRLALLGIGLCLLSGLGGLAFLTWLTQGGFLRHIVLYNVNAFSLGAAGRWLWTIRWETVNLVLALGGIAAAWGRLRETGTLWRRLRAGDETSVIVAIFAVHMLLATPALVAVGKVGANSNYFIEAMCGWSVPIGCLLAVALDRWRAAAPFRRHALVLLAPLVLAVKLTGVSLPPTRTMASPATMHDMAALERRMAEASRPVISDEIVVLTLAGKQVQYEPGMFADLRRHGLWDDTALAARIDAHEFAFIVTDGDDGSGLYRDRYTAAMRAAIDRSYPGRRHVYRYTVRLP